jgi:hypothetical protein
MFRFTKILVKGEYVLTWRNKTPNIRLKLQATSDTQILHLLHKHVISLLPQPCRSDTQFNTLSASTVSGLNTLLARSTVLWEFYSVAAVLGLSPNVAVQIGSHIDYDRISTLKYINEHAPDVPTPAVYGVLRSKNRTYLFMARINGVSLDNLWPAMNEAQKISSRDQLTPLFKSLRAIPMPPSEDGKLTLGGGQPRRCKDQCREVRIASHPIGSEEALNDFLLDTNGKKTVSYTATMLRKLLRSNHRMVMTHSDLHPRNIMAVMEPAEEVSDRVADNIKTARIRVVAIIDWEVCGWYLEYWEYTKACHNALSGDVFQDWFDYIPTNAIGNWPGDFATDAMITRYVD